VIAIDWVRPPAHLALSGTAVHIWRAALNLAEAQVAALGLALCPDEHARAERLRFEDKRRAFVAARGILRAILGRYLNLSPQHVQFSYNAQGKPELAGSEAAGLQFNLAHSGDLALVALTQGRPVGVDLERQHPVEALDRLVAGYFAPGERAVWGQLPPEQRLSAFFTGWTRKEAYLKARGEGLTMPLDAFEVTLAPGAPPALLADRHSPPSAAPWVLLDVEAAPGYAAALAVAGPVGELATWQWPATG
jgi:4'-phosphopantetheinyl transferase